MSIVFESVLAYVYHSVHAYRIQKSISRSWSSPSVFIWISGINLGHQA